MPKLLIRLLLLWAIGGLTALLSINNFASTLQPSIFIKLQDAKPGKAIIYWNTGDGYKESSIQKHPTGNYSTQTIRFKIPRKLESFRIDLDVFEAPYFLAEINLGYFPDSPIFIFDVFSSYRFNDITPIPHQKGAQIQTPKEHSDPFLEFQFSESLYPIIDKQFSDLIFKIWLYCFGLLTLLSAFLIPTRFRFPHWLNPRDSSNSKA